ncbi:GNAT family N-acetyltransferase [Glaciecola sp. 1036]|uniref:GNAT family N-acetyltransferase n=1 Tax=Alteromonadaceae TaxID=72275 RepID=UPI003D07569C
MTSFLTWLQAPLNEGDHRDFAVVEGLQTVFTHSKQLPLLQQKNVLVVTKTVYENFQTVTAKNINAYLGQEFDYLLFDATNDFDASQFFAALGLLKSPGRFVLLVPALASIDSQFLRHLLDTARQQPNTSWFSAQLIDIKASLNIQQYDDSSTREELLSEHQTCVIKEIDSSLENVQIHAVLGERGRGKSTLLAELITSFLEKSIPITYTSMGRSNCHVIDKFIAELAPEIGRLASFAAADMAALNPKTDILFIDEIASISPVLISQYLKLYKTIIFAGTSHGYEGTGRGLINRLIPSITNIKIYELNTPFRWYIDDPLEQWVNQLLFPVNTNLRSHVKVQTSDFTFISLNKADVLASVSLYQQLVSLLINAHYQTSPNDIQRIFDDDSYHIMASLDSKRDSILGVCILIDESMEIEQALATQIALGNRRLKGHLFTQNLALHINEPSICHLKFFRVLRIAIQPELQGLGIGSKLLDYVRATTEQSNSILCTNFGFTDRLHNFWQKNDFALIKVGQKIDSASGTFSCFYIAASALQHLPQKQALLAQLLLDLDYFKQYSSLNNKHHALLANFEETPNFQDLYEYSHKKLHLFLNQKISLNKVISIVFNIAIKQSSTELQTLIKQWQAKGIHKEVRIQLEEQIRFLIHSII